MGAWIVDDCGFEHDCSIVCLIVDFKDGSDDISGAYLKLVGYDDLYGDNYSPVFNIAEFEIGELEEAVNNLIQYKKIF